MATVGDAWRGSGVNRTLAKSPLVRLLQLLSLVPGVAALLLIFVHTGWAFWTLGCMGVITAVGGAAAAWRGEDEIALFGPPRRRLHNAVVNLGLAILWFGLAWQLS
jgi:hypothetical protein